MSADSGRRRAGPRSARRIPLASVMAALTLPWLPYLVVGCAQGTIGLGGGGEAGVGAEMGPPGPNPCGDFDPSCTQVGFGPPPRPFPLPSDPMADPNVGSGGVDRDMDGYIGLSVSHVTFDFVYSANTEDWGHGTVSKIDSRSVKEVARYPSVTCYSNPGGGRQPCDGTNGCCSRDDHVRYTNRGAGQPDGPHQPVQLSANNPSRTAVDYNGDVWVANRAFGGQSSVTKIANDPGECSDRNGEPGVQTSHDTNGDGVIDSDCNRNGVPDDVADVKAAPCANGMAQEYYGFDDECVLFTTNTNVPDRYGRPLALGRGAVDFGPSDAWPGCYQDGMFFRVDGTSGQIKAQAQVNGNPYGAAVDASGILWATGVGGGPLNYFDTGNPAMSAQARSPTFALGGYGITMDRDQNVWMGGYPYGHAYRYTPNRSAGFADLGQGFWTVVQNVGVNSGAGGCMGRGVGADSRSMNTYFVWMACHEAPFLARIDASAIPLPMGGDQVVDGSAMPAVQIAGGGVAGAGVDNQQNVWTIAYTGSVATRVLVDALGNPTPPNLAGPFNQGCPAAGGDVCTLGLNGVSSDPRPYTYSDFTGFGLRNFTEPKGFYSWIQKGCASGDTKWMRVVWDAVVPPNTSLAVRARTGNTPTPGQGWGAWTAPATTSPAPLDGVVMPNPNPYIQVEFDFTTMDKSASPKLKSFSVTYECGNIPG